MTLITSAIEVQNQVTNALFNIPGSSVNLEYRSAYMPGYKWSRKIEVPLFDSPSDDIDPRDSDLFLGVKVKVHVAGDLEEKFYPSDTDSESHVSIWDGTDATGRPVNGSLRAKVRLGYMYKRVYRGTNRRLAGGGDGSGSGGGGGGSGGGSSRVTQSFGSVPGADMIDLSPERDAITVWEERTTTLESNRSDALGFGGWSPNRVRNANREDIRTSDLGSRSIERVELEAAANFEPIIKDQEDQTLRDRLESIRMARSHLTISADGTMYFADIDGDSEVVYSIGPTGVSHVAGSGEQIPTGSSGDGGLATEATFRDINDLAIGDNDGLYIADGKRIRRVGNDGMIQRVAGVTRQEAEFEKTPNDDLGAALETELDTVNDIAVGPRGSLYFAEDGWLGGQSGTVRRIAPNGQIQPIAGTFNSDDKPANLGEFLDQVASGGNALEQYFAPQNIAVDSQGTVYVQEEIDNRINLVRAIDPDGQVQLFAGSPTDLEPRFDTSRDGSVATAVQLGTIVDITVGPNDGVYLSEEYDTSVQQPGRSVDVITKVTADRRLLTVAGGVLTSPGTNGIAEGTLPTSVRLFLDPWLATRPDGSLYFSIIFPDEGFVRVTPSNVDSGASGSIAPSRDGKLVYEFDRDFRHRSTKHAVAGLTYRNVEYTENGLVRAVVDNDGRRTTFERDDQENLSAIEAPSGQRTTFTTDANGYLKTATYPDGRQIELHHSAGGLLQRYVDAEGNVTEFSYDSLGRTKERIEATGAIADLVRSETDDGLEVRRVSPEMREVSHTLRSKTDGLFTSSSCCGGVSSSTTISRNGGEWDVSRSDGSSKNYTQGPDPRFGDAAPLTSEATETSAGGRSITATTKRTVTRSEGGGRLDIEDQTETVTINGRTYERTISADASGYTVEITTPESRRATLQYGPDGRLSELTISFLSPVTFQYNDSGLEEFTQKGATTTFEYDDNDFLEVLIDATDRRVEMTRDVTGRILSYTRGSGATEEFEYDDNDNLVELTRPNGDVHTFTPTKRNRMSAYTPPSGRSESLTYDGDGLMGELTRASDRSISNSYTADGRLGSTDHADASIDYKRNEAGHVESIEWASKRDGTSQTINLGRDGFAITEQTYVGPASGTFLYGLDAAGYTTEITYPDGTSHTVTLDDDKVRTAVGPFSYVRDGPDAATTEISDGTLTTDIFYDDRGRVSSRTHTIAGETIYAIEYTYDEVGRIKERTETVAGSTNVFGYSYDEDGRLESVTQGENTIEAYEYDLNSNRESATVDGTSEAATFLTGDKLDERGGVSYEYDDDGFLSQRGSDSFEYSAAGELMEATVADETITYAYDGYGRRVARTDETGTTEYLYGDPSRPWQLTIARDPDGTRTRYHYDPEGRVMAFERDGNWFYVATDQVGTPRVVTASDGTVVKRIERDAFGRLLTDSAPDFTLHLGFAGGVRDPKTGFVRLGLRDYEPAAGRWTARDPLLLASGQYNFYTYGRNDPVNVVDRNGLSWSCFFENVHEDAQTALEYTSPIKTALSAGSDVADATGLTGAVEEAAQAGSLWALGQAGPSGAVAGSASSAATGAAVDGLMKAAKTGSVSATKYAAKKAAIGSIGVDAANYAGAYAGAALGNANLWGRSLTDRLADGLVNLDPLGMKPPGTSGGGEDRWSIDCGAKSPGNC